MFTIIIPLYNKEAFVGQTIRSLQSQTFKDFEAIFVDDGSTDHSCDIVNEVQDKRFKLLRKTNGGPSSARNYGVKYAKFDWILYLDADDYLLPRALELFHKYIITSKNIDCVFGNFYYEKNGKRRLYSKYKDGIIKNNFRAFVLGKCMPRTGAAVYRKKVLLQYPFREYIRRNEDIEQLFRLFKAIRFFRFADAVFVYNAEGFSAKFPRADIREDFSAYLKIGRGISWENIALYKMYILGKQSYYDECKKLYPSYSHKIMLWICTRIITNRVCERIFKLI